MNTVVIKNKMAIEKMRMAGALLAQTVREAGESITEGMTTHDLDFIIENKMKLLELKPVCKGYGSYKHASCISVNNVIVHGVPSKEVILKSGDFVKIDVVGSYKGYCADMARGFFVGEVSPVVKKLAQTAQQALDAGIEQAVPGNRLHDISAAIQHIVEEAGFGVVRYFAGHGIGRNIHELPDVPNYGKAGTGIILREGMALAIEPMITQWDYAVKIQKDGWTATTVDGGLAAHVEDTIVITPHGAEILTRA